MPDDPKPQVDPNWSPDGGKIVFGGQSNEPGGNIRVVFLFRTDRGLAFVDRPGGTSTGGTTVVNNQATGGAVAGSHSSGPVISG